MRRRISLGLVLIAGGLLGVACAGSSASDPLPPSSTTTVTTTVQSSTTSSTSTAMPAPSWVAAALDFTLQAGPSGHIERLGHNGESYNLTFTLEPPAVGNTTGRDGGVLPEVTFRGLVELTNQTPGKAAPGLGQVMLYFLYLDADDSRCPGEGLYHENTVNGQSACLVTRTRIDSVSGTIPPEASRRGHIDRTEPIGREVDSAQYEQLRALLNSPPDFTIVALASDSATPDPELCFLDNLGGPSEPVLAVLDQGANALPTSAFHQVGEAKCSLTREITWPGAARHQLANP